MVEPTVATTPAAMKSTRETNRTAAIRRVLARAGKPLDLYTLWEKVERDLRMVIGRKQLYDLLSMMQTHGEITTAGRAETRTYALKR